MKDEEIRKFLGKRVHVKVRGWPFKEMTGKLITLGGGVLEIWNDHRQRIFETTDFIEIKIVLPFPVGSVTIEEYE